MNSSNERGERPMDWMQFLNFLADQVDDPIVKEAITDCISRGDLLTACEIARTGLRPQTFRTHLLRCFAERRFQVAPIHEDLVAIDSRIVLTTNVDKIYEMAAMSILHGDILVKSYTDADVADVVRRQNRCLIKIHGTVDSPLDTVFTRSDYAKARVSNADFYRVIDALFTTHTFLFLGASMKDPDMMLLLEDYALRHPGTRPHYVVMPDGGISAPVLRVAEDSMNLQTIAYDPANNHEALQVGIKDLKALVDVARAQLLETMDW
ncbi:SIR2 family NAD-dependent protein deacylase [Achromobacter insolitus]|jgi:hypothetical protein|uniref:SIR2 family NAD-dependent protein deacylase n=1 Tax=Achromobacter insolitus TaxID=217204 RepID=UPI002420089F|nr:SIR2 family protein [Achromobacter insolitus]